MHKIGFVSLGCPKATYDSEQILTRLRAEGYAIVPSYVSVHSRTLLTLSISPELFLSDHTPGLVIMDILHC